MRWPLLLLLTACGTANPTAATNDASLPDAALLPDASRPPLSAECQARRSNWQAAMATVMAFDLDDHELPRQTIETFDAVEQVPSPSGDPWAFIHGTTARGPATLFVSWLRGWTPPDLSHRTVKIARERAFLACDQASGNHEPGTTLAIRVDDADGTLLFFRGATSTVPEEVPLPASVPLPEGVAFRWKPNVGDTCAQGEASLVVHTADGETAVPGGARLDLAIAGTPSSLLVGDASAPRGTGSYCSGSISFILFKKGLFVPPAN